LNNYKKIRTHTLIKMFIKRLKDKEIRKIMKSKAITKKDLLKLT